MDSDINHVFLCESVMAVHDGRRSEAPPTALQDWVVDPDCSLEDSESEDVLHAIDPNELFSNRTPTDTNEVFHSEPLPDPSSENGGSVPDEPTVTTATIQLAQGTVYQVVYDFSGVGGATVEPGQENVVSIELGNWNSSELLPDSCIVNELPVQSGCLTGFTPHHHDQVLLQLTEEEQKLLSQEGVSLPSRLPLTKAEERILKKVRRKIRNKLSAQDSRRRRKEYIDGLENRAAVCSEQNKQLQRTVEQLEKKNRSLMAQLQQLQSMIRQSVSKGAQTSTCLLIIVVSLALILLPSFSPFLRRRSDDDYRPMGVISRNILTDPSSSQPSAEGADAPSVQPRPSSDLSQSDPSEDSAIFKEPVGTQGKAQVGVAEHKMDQSETRADAVTEQTEGNQSKNRTAAVTRQTELKSGLRHHDAAKSSHADEM
ncbi:cyclic AMP-responsive element-binding protein 3-like protein 4 isoform 1-T2 [Pholidichthys leucotaenia]